MVALLFSFPAVLDPFPPPFGFYLFDRCGVLYNPPRSSPFKTLGFRFFFPPRCYSFLDRTLLFLPERSLVSSLFYSFRYFLLAIFSRFFSNYSPILEWRGHPLFALDPSAPLSRYDSLSDVTLSSHGAQSTFCAADPSVRPSGFFPPSRYPKLMVDPEGQVNPKCFPSFIRSPRVL